MDQIKLTGLEFFAHHGVLESEKQLGQIFSIDCILTFDTSLCEDALERTVNYASVSEDIVHFATTHCFDLLETLVNHLAKMLLVKYPLIDTLTLTVHKPHAPIKAKFSDVSVCITRGWKTCYLGIGSNLGDQKAYLDSVVQAINKDDYMTLLAQSSYIETPPYGILDQPNFLNGALKVRTLYTPHELLAFCQKLEQAAGRVRTRHWGERTLDVDILLYGQEVLFTKDLMLPHPEMHLRDFVLKPLCEIDPYLIHPIKKQSISELLHVLNKA